MRLPYHSGLGPGAPHHRLSRRRAKPPTACDQEEEDRRKGKGAAEEVMQRTYGKAAPQSTRPGRMTPSYARQCARQGCTFHYCTRTRSSSWCTCKQEAHHFSCIAPSSAVVPAARSAKDAKHTRKVPATGRTRLNSLLLHLCLAVVQRVQGVLPHALLFFARALVCQGPRHTGL